MKYWEESLYLALEALDGEIGLRFWDSLTSYQQTELAESLATSAVMEYEVNSYSQPSMNDLIDDKIRGIVRNYSDELSRRDKREADYEAKIEWLEHQLRKALDNSCMCGTN